jgi:hypothetical protein
MKTLYVEILRRKLITMWLTMVGVAWITFYAYRLLIERIPRDVVPENIQGKLLMICLAMTMIIIYGAVMIFQLKRLKNKEIKLNKLMKLCKVIMENFYFKPLKYVWNNYISRLYKVKDLTMEIAGKLDRNIQNDLDVKVILIKLYYMPKLIFVWILFIEISININRLYVRFNC